MISHREISQSSYKQAVISAQLPGEEQYWRRQLDGEWVKSTFPYPREKSQDQFNCQMRSIKSRLSGELFSRLMKLSNDSDYRLHMIAVAWIMVLLHKYTGCEDIIVGTPVFRQKFEIEFVNKALVLRCRWHNPGISFKQLLLQVRETVTGANDNQNYPVEHLPHLLGIPFSPGDDFPLFDVAALVKNIQNKTYIRDIHANIIFSFQRLEDTVECLLEYNSLRYERESMEKLRIHFFNLWQQVLYNVDIKIIRYINGARKNPIVNGF